MRGFRAHMRYRRQMHGLGDIERAARLDHAGGEMVPSAQVFDRDVEAVGDRDQSVACAGDIAQGMGLRGDRDGDDEFVARGDGTG